MVGIPPDQVAPQFLRDLPNVPTAQDWPCTCHIAHRHVAFHAWQSCRHPVFACFRGSISCLCVPLSTLQRIPYENRHMTRGHRGWLGLRCALFHLLLHAGLSRRYLPCPAHTSQISRRKKHSEERAVIFAVGFQVRAGVAPRAPHRSGRENFLIWSDSSGDGKSSILV